MNTKTRCHWVTKDQIYIDYHDQKWGKPVFDSHELFMMLCLEGAQAGLSWFSILKRIEGYKKAFFDFDPEKMAKISDKQVEKLMKDERIIRNRLKIIGFSKNAKAFLEMKKQKINFSEYLWSFTNKKTLKNENKKGLEIAKIISKDLKKRGFTFVGETIIYAFMQAVGIINDHEKKCFCYKK